MWTPDCHDQTIWFRIYSNKLKEGHDAQSECRPQCKILFSFDSATKEVYVIVYVAHLLYRVTLTLQSYNAKGTNIDSLIEDIIGRPRISSKVALAAKQSCTERPQSYYCFCGCSGLRLKNIHKYENNEFITEILGLDIYTQRVPSANFAL